MSIWDIFKSRDKPNPTQDAVSNAPVFYFGTSGAGKAVTVRSSIQMTTVYACVRVIAETIASLPLHVCEVTDSGVDKAMKHPLYRVLHDEPNAEMTSFVWRETMLTHLLLWGNAYCQIIRNGRGAVIGVYPLLPENMVVDRDASGNLTYTYTTTGGKTVVLSQYEVLHIPGLGFDGIMGYSPIALEKNAVGLGLAAEEYGGKFFANGARPSGVLTHPNTVKDPKRLRENWNSVYGGSSNNGKVAVLEEGMTFSPVSMPNNEAQFLETRKFQVSEICRIFRVPPHLVGDLEHATFSNIEHQSISFGVHTIRPWLTRLEQSMNKALFSEREKGRFYVRFNMDGLLRGDYKSRMEGYAIARQNGWLSANDIRELENLNPISEENGGNAYMVNGNMIPLSSPDLVEEAKQIDIEKAKNELETMKLQLESMRLQLEVMEAEQELVLEVVDDTQEAYENGELDETATEDENAEQSNTESDSESEDESSEEEMDEEESEEEEVKES